MYSHIYNPENGRQYSLMGKEGKLILKNYLILLTGGGKCSHCGMKGHNITSCPQKKLTIDNILWSKGPYIDDYSKLNTEKDSRKGVILDVMKKANKVVFIRMGSYKKVTDLDTFAKNLHTLKNPVILITSDGDRSVPSSYSKKTIDSILNSDKIVCWQTQNYDGSIIHPKLKHHPIGFNLHTSRWLINEDIPDKIKFMVSSRMNAKKISVMKDLRQGSPVTNRISDRILCDTHHARHHARQRMYKMIKKNKLIDFTSKRQSFADITSEYNNYNFVLSPRGNGLDCHRTWELFLAGVIVITRTSSLDEMYTKHNLPVVILEDWDELNNDLENKLKRWYKKYKGRTSIKNIFPKLTFDYWLK